MQLDGAQKEFSICYATLLTILYLSNKTMSSYKANIKWCDKKSVKSYEEYTLASSWTTRVQLKEGVQQIKRLF